MKKLACSLLLASVVTASEADLAPLTSFDQILTMLPDKVQLDQSRPGGALGLEVANQALEAQAIGRKMQLKLTFSSFDHETDSPYGDVVLGLSRVPAYTTNHRRIMVNVRVHFAREYLQTLATVSSTTPQIFHGVIAQAEMQPGSYPELGIDIISAQLGEEIRRAASPSGPTRIKILSAVYGSGKDSTDVTDTVQQRVEVEKQGFSVSAKGLGLEAKNANPGPLTIVFTKDGVRHLQVKADNESVLPESFTMPQDAAELAAWLSNTRWKADAEIMFMNDGQALVGGKAATWQAMDERQFSLTQPNGSKEDYRFNASWSSFSPSKGKAKTFSRVKS